MACSQVPELFAGGMFQQRTWVADGSSIGCLPYHPQTAACKLLQVRLSQQYQWLVKYPARVHALVHYENMEDTPPAADTQSPPASAGNLANTSTSTQNSPPGGTPPPCTPPAAGSFPTPSFTFAMAPWLSGESKSSALGGMGARLYSRSRSVSRPQQRRSFFSQAPEARSEADLLQHEEQAFYGAYACKNMTRSARVQLARIATYRVVEQGELLCIPGSHMDSVYFILDGQVEYIPRGEDGDSVPAATLGPGSSLGTFHLPARRVLDGSSACAVSEQLTWGGYATATTDVEVAVVKQKQWLQVATGDPLWDARQVCLFLEELPVFGHFSRTQLFEVARMVRTRRVAAGTLVYKQAMEGDHVYIIRKGFVRMLRELRAGKQEVAQLNAMTYTVAGLSAQATNLASPRQQVPYYMPLTAASGGFLVTPRLGEVHGSGAQTHRARLQHVASPGSITTSGAPNPFRDCPVLQDQDDHTSFSVSPKREDRPSVRKTFRIHCPEQEEELSAGPASPAASQPLGLPPALTPVDSGRPALGRQESGKRCQKQATLAAPRISLSSVESPPSPRRLMPAQSRRPPNVPPLQIPVSPSGQDSTHVTNVLPHRESTAAGRDSGSTPHRDSAADDHLRDIRRTATRVLTRTLSRRQITQQSPLAAIAPAITPVIPTYTRTDSGAADRLLETLRSRKASMMLGVMGESADRKASTISEGRPPSSQASMQAIRVRAASQVSIGTAGSNASPPTGRFAEVLGPHAYHPFTCVSPRLLQPQSTSLFVELALLGSGRVFGEGLKGNTNKQRPTSAVADTDVELIVLQKSELEARLGDLVSFLWCQEPMKDYEPLTSDAAVKRHLHDAMKWEVYKKQLLKDVLAQKRAKLDLLRVAA